MTTHRRLLLSLLAILGLVAGADAFGACKRYSARRLADPAVRFALARPACDSIESRANPYEGINRATTCVFATHDGQFSAVGAVETDSLASRLFLGVDLIPLTSEAHASFLRMKETDKLVRCRGDGGPLPSDVAGFIGGYRVELYLDSAKSRVKLPRSLECQVWEQPVVLGPPELAYLQAFFRAVQARPPIRTETFRFRTATPY